MADVAVTDQTFDEEVLKSQTPVLVDFWAEWCGPCKIVAPTIEKLGEKYKGKLKVTKMNVDDNPNVPSQYGIMSIPTIYIFKDGKPQKSLIGAQPEEAFDRAIGEVLNG